MPMIRMTYKHAWLEVYVTPLAAKDVARLSKMGLVVYMYILILL